MTLTKRQKEVLDFLVTFVNKHGYSPSFEEIARALRLTSLATVHKHITTLERKGIHPPRLQPEPLDRSDATAEAGARAGAGPAHGGAAAGRAASPRAVRSKRSKTAKRFRSANSRAPDNNFVLQVKGNSMIEDHIMNGDYIVVEPTQVANPGEIVVALVGGDEATLKRFYREPGGKIRLQPANSEMQPIIVPAADVKIQGRVVGVLRKY